ncbi:MAG: glycosyltransferase family 2 protein [Candidatus Bathyarchaeia archaeon]|jgi:GT2 family glycosyltransferase
MNATITIIVATKSRPRDLSVFLESVNKVDDKFFELIVVDSSRDNFVIEQNRLNTLKANGKYYIFNEKGLSKARNYGIKNSSGEIIVFADDDFIVTSGWLINLLKRFADPQISCVTGRMISLRQDDSSTLYERTMSFDRGSKCRFFSKEHLQVRSLISVLSKIGQKRLAEQTPVPWAVGFGFCSFRRDVFYTVGFFDVTLGRGTKAIGADDTDMFYRILKSGLNICYEPTAVILHNHRLDKAKLFEDFFNSGKSVFSFVSKHFRQDLYVKFIALGYICLLVFSDLRAFVVSDKELKLAISMELKGFLYGKR